MYVFVCWFWVVFSTNKSCFFPLVNEQSVGGRLRVRYLSESSKMIRVKWKKENGPF